MVSLVAQSSGHLAWAAATLVELCLVLKVAHGKQEARRREDHSERGREALEGVHHSLRAEADSLRSAVVGESGEV
jgi:hypothetical protein